jgi:nicotinamide riboside kinase
VRDTDLVSTAAYAAWYYGLRAAWLDRAARARRAGHYLLCDVDLPWEPDPARDPSMADPARRGDVLRAMVDALNRFECAWSWVRGAGDTRVKAAETALGAAPDQNVRRAVTATFRGARM